MNDDLIRRQAAIDEAKKLLDYYGTNDITKEFADLAAEQFMNRVPSAQPERKKGKRKKGKWIDYTEDGYVECPFCHSATNCDGNKEELHFCFSCGAEMRGGS